MLASTLVAETSPTAALHMIAPSSFLDPPGAVWALLNLLSDNELLKCFFVLVFFMACLVLFAAHAFVEYDPTVETEVFIAVSAFEFSVSFIENECKIALWIGTPGHILLLFYCMVKSVRLKLVHFLLA